MEDLIRDWGYIILFLYSFGGGFLALVVAGILSFSGELNTGLSPEIPIQKSVVGNMT